MAGVQFTDVQARPTEFLDQGNGQKTCHAVLGMNIKMPATLDWSSPTVSEVVFDRMSG